ncbi:hypothetical protein ACFGVS_24290 [Mucilaginibacter sp. AW1-7]|uniref:hypothetical protein n=1 Tax=Mucilaginibacter sp. AW1-7 TaxID=3349874 RepID=UPI003F731F54
MQPKIELAKTRDFGEIISDTFLFIKQNLKPLLSYFFTFCGIFIVAATISACLMQLKMTTNFNNLTSGAYTNQYAPSFFNFFGIEFALTMVFTLLSITAIMVTVFCYMALYKEKGNQVPTAEEMWGYIKFYFLKILGSSILINLLLAVGFVFCLIPGIYMSPILALVAPIMIMENTSFGYAFNRSFVLIKENWWATFGALVVTWIIFSVCRAIIVVPVSIVNAISLVTHVKGGAHFSIAAAVIGAALQQVCQVFIIIPVVSLCLCYFNLTESKDGTSLLNRINKVGTTTPDNDLPLEEY